MEERNEANERWQQLLAVRESVEDEDLALPAVVSRIDGRSRENSPRAVSFARALAVTDAWSGISAARERLERRAA